MDRSDCVDARALREDASFEADAEGEKVGGRHGVCLATPLLEGDWQQLEGVPRPMDEEGSHFLAWNDCGHIARFQDGQRMEVQHALKEHRPQRVAAMQHMSMASISDDVCCFASGADADGGSQLIIRPLERWDKAVFTAFLGGEDEKIQAVASGKGFVAALTSCGMLRVYSASGLPLGVLSVQGSPVALAAGGPLLMVVTSVGSASDDTESSVLDYRLLDVRGKTQRSSGYLPVSEGAGLRWLGISRELVPTSVDTKGVVRALVGSGPGSWGPVGGGGAEWVPVGNLADEEERLGPLWVVHAARGSLFCAVVGKAREEPLPQSRAIDLKGDGSRCFDDSTTPHFGTGASLKEVQWRLQLGAGAAVCGAVLEDTLRQELLGRHIDEMIAAGLLPKDWQSTADAVAKAWRSKPMFLFGTLVKRGEVERALDVATNFLHTTGGGGPLLLGKARQFAEAAGQHKLADCIAEIPVTQMVQQRIPPLSSSPAIAMQSDCVTESGLSTALPMREQTHPAVPKLVRQELPALFVSEEDTPAIPDRLPESSATVLQDAQLSPSPTKPAPAQTLGTLEPVAEMRSNPIQSSNPFKRKSAAPRATANAPHLLRDSLGSGVVVGRPAATPVRASEGITHATEPAPKIPKVQL